MSSDNPRPGTASAPSRFSLCLQRKMARSDDPSGPERSAARMTLTAPRPRLAPTRDRGTVAVLLFRDAPLFEASIPITVFGVDRRGMGLPYYRLLVVGGAAGPPA